MERNNPKAKKKNLSTEDIHNKENRPERNEIESREENLKKATQFVQIQLKIEEPFPRQENILDKTQVKVEENTSQREAKSQKTIGKPEEGDSRFPWEERWLRGDEYYQLLKHVKYCSETFGFQTYDQIPEVIYFEPKNGTIFYLKGFTFEKIHFPRVYNFKKKFKWKKMNFITHLPKNSPKVSYLVASTTYTEYGELSYRMHFVIPYDKCNDLMLCHILQVHPRTNFQNSSLGMNFPKISIVKQESIEETIIPQPEIPETANEPEKVQEKQQPVKKSKVFKKKYIKKLKVQHKFLKKTKQGNAKKILVNLSQETIKKEEEKEGKGEEMLPTFPKVDLEYEITEGFFNFPVFDFFYHMNPNPEQIIDDDYYNPYKNPMRSFMAYNLRN